MSGEKEKKKVELKEEYLRLYEELSPEERRERIILQPEFREAYNEITEAHRQIPIPNYFWKKWVQLLGPVASVLYIQLRQYCFYNPETGEKRNWCWPKQSTLAREIGIKDPKTIRKGLVTLEEYGFIRREPVFRQASSGRMAHRGSDKYIIYFEIPLLPEDAAEVFFRKMNQAQSESSDRMGNFSLFGESDRKGIISLIGNNRKGKESRIGEEVVDNLDRKGNISRLHAGDNFPSRTNTRTITSNVDNVEINLKEENSNLNSAKNSESKKKRSPKQESFIVEIGETLKRLCSDRSVGNHPSIGFHTRIVEAMPEHFIREALTATRDAIEDERSGRKKLRGDASAYFAGTVKRIAEREGIVIPVKWK